MKTTLLFMLVCPLLSQQAVCYDLAYIPIREQYAC